ncbi:MAG: acyl carrier protein [Deltaproteobacteria bacterium]|nr:acyl carrier protein [Deltaproteobacteria bacterium]MBM4341390.1 acyl carrier protein [Deltaproteobacteria bacterium]
MNLYEEIKEMIKAELAVDDEAVVPEAHLQDDLGADSLGLLNLAEAIDARYGLQLQGDDLVDIPNVGELVALVESKIALKS